MIPKTIIVQRITFKNTSNNYAGNYFVKSSKQELQLNTIEFLSNLGCFCKI